MDYLNKIKFYHYIISSVISVFITVFLYNILYSFCTYKNISDFYVGTTIYLNHNKLLDVLIFLIYLIVFFVILPIIIKLTSKIAPAPAGGGGWS